MAYNAPYSAQVIGGDAPLRCNDKTKFASGSVTKRLLDLALAAVMLVLALPLMGILSCLLWLDGGPCLFAHTRIGAGGKPFQCLKFRTMVSDGAATLRSHLARNPEAAREWSDCAKLRNDPRVTRLGKFLRGTSLDELPQLINILRGEMSLVGPRPITEAEAARYGSAIGLYYAVRPGITGLWQIGGRSLLSYEQRVELDTRYVLERTLWGDLLIIAKTIPAVLSRDGAH